MRSLVLSALALFAVSCKPREIEAGLLVKVTIDATATSKCMQLEIRANGTSRTSDPAVLAGKTLVTVGVAQGSFPAQVDLRAIGFTDEACQTRSRDESVLTSATFDAKAVREVALTLKRVAPKTETSCENGVDDDMDGTIDCGDSDCDDKPCTSTAVCLEATRCMNGTCSGGQMRVCRMPPGTCFQTDGVCSSFDGGCLYTAKAATETCDDQDVCTTQDRCAGDGGCRGVPVSCQQSTDQCRESMGSCGDGGCAFAPKVDAGCNDTDSCTVGDLCDGQGTCRGTRVSCAPTSCRTFTGQCFADGGCDFAMVDAGTACDGGVCTLGGDCLARFPFQPSNFDVTQMRAPPAAPTVLDCGETTIDTGATGNMRLTNWCRGQPFEATVIPQPGGPDALLVSMSGLTITNDGGLTVIGTRPIIFAVLGDVSITGQVVTFAGPSVCTSGAGADGTTSTLSNGGGSGAGFRTAGGNGGRGQNVADQTSVAPGGQAEAQTGPQPLRGGCSGGRGGGQSSPAALGGGALQISASGQLALNGVVAAPGRGGAGGAGDLVKGKGGNGGGSGGMLVLEAATLVVSGGAVTANGGSGGEGGGVAPSADGNAGADGPLATSTGAAGGSGGAVAGGEGGVGGAGAPAGDGTVNIAGGGGGGATGLIIFRGPGSCSVGPQVIVSPDAGCP